MLGGGSRSKATALIIELPWDLGVPDDHEVGPPALAGRAEEGEGPCWLRFRTVEVPTQLPLAACDLAFGDLSGDEASTASEREGRAAAVKGFVDKPFLARRTVAVVYVQREREFPLEKNDEMAEALRRGLKALNDFLVSLGVLFNDQIRPISLDELPPLLPVMTARRLGGVFCHGPSQLIPLRPPRNETQTRRPVSPAWPPRRSAGREFAALFLVDALLPTAQRNRPSWCRFDVAVFGSRSTRACSIRCGHSRGDPP